MKSTLLRKVILGITVATLGFCWTCAAHAGSGEMIEEILGTPQGIPVKEFKMTAKRFEFTPKVIAVSQGDYFKLKITALDADHGFKIPGTNIKHILKKGKEEDIVLYARDRGKLGFECCKFCGLGHPFMKGTIIIE